MEAGTQLGHYTVLSEIGRGGMGEVWRARDTKLGREVAIKILPEEFSRDPDRLARFEREAKLLASLNHPNIAAIHGFEEDHGTHFLVLELVEGATLADRLRHGAIPIQESLTLAVQIAEALEAAHDKGVIHRDLKPANIKVTHEGRVKVLDFGLAKVFGDDESDVNLSNSPTLSMTATQQGVILGTAAYMSPEQAMGNKVDRRTDIFSFGAVLYEMLRGRQAFKGQNVSDILASVLKVEPNWSQLPKDTPAGVRRLLRRCLQKDRNRRLQTAIDMRIEIEDAKGETDSSISPPQFPVSRSRERLAWIVAIFIAVVGAGFAVAYFRTATDAPEMRVEITTPPTPAPYAVTISPDGQKIAFLANSEGGLRLFVRLLNSSVAQPLTEADVEGTPFWSPDSRSVGFFSDGKLKTIRIDGGAVQTLASAAGVGRSATWNRDGTILFRAAVGPILRVPSTGGDPAPVELESPGVQHSSPLFLPDGRHFFYAYLGPPETRGVYIASLDGPETKRLIDEPSRVAYLVSGQLLFTRQGTLFAQQFDTARMELLDAPVPLAEQVLAGSLSASIAGSIVYRSGSAAGPFQRQLVWLDRSGTEVEKVGDLDDADPVNPALSPDGRRVALDRNDGNRDIWLFDLRLGGLSRFTFAPQSDGIPIWSPDGRRIIFQSNRDGEWDLYQKPATGAGNAQLLLTTPQAKVPMDWLPDRRLLLYRSLDPAMGFDLWTLPMDGDPKPSPLIRTEFNESGGQFSPDGKWIAFQSNQSGHYEIYVQSFPSLEGKFQISTNGGAQPRWEKDGKELFYIGLDGRLMAAPIRFTPDGGSIQVVPPVPLFLTHVGGALQPALNQQQYAVSSDGQHFLMNNVVERPASPITMLLNWRPPAN